MNRSRSWILPGAAIMFFLVVIAASFAIRLQTLDPQSSSSSSLEHESSTASLEPPGEASRSKDSNQGRSLYTFPLDLLVDTTAASLPSDYFDGDTIDSEEPTQPIDDPTANQLESFLQYEQLLSSRIVGGNSSEPGAYPYFVKIGWLDNKVHCGGTLISPFAVLTAAHCNKPVDELTLTINGYRASDDDNEDAIQRLPTRTVEHPSFSRATFTFDAMIIFLDEPIPEDTIPPVQLNNIGSLPEEGDELLVFGLGTLQENRDEYPDSLQEVRLDVVPIDQCSVEYKEVAEIREEIMFCAAREGRDSCQGDSGGPILDANAAVQLGIVSLGCGRPNYSGVYTRVSAILGWVTQELCNEAYDRSIDYCDGETAPGMPFAGAINPRQRHFNVEATLLVGYGKASFSASSLPEDERTELETVFGELVDEAITKAFPLDEYGPVDLQSSETASYEEIACDLVKSSVDDSNLVDSADVPVCLEVTARFVLRLDPQRQDVPAILEVAKQTVQDSVDSGEIDCNYARSYPDGPFTIFNGGGCGDTRSENVPGTLQDGETSATTEPQSNSPSELPSTIPSESPSSLPAEAATLPTGQPTNIPTASLVPTGIPKARFNASISFEFSTPQTDELSVDQQFWILDTQDHLLSQELREEFTLLVESDDMDFFFLDTPEWVTFESIECDIPLFFDYDAVERSCFQVEITWEFVLNPNIPESVVTQRVDGIFSDSLSTGAMQCTLQQRYPREDMIIYSGLACPTDQPSLAPSTMVDTDTPAYSASPTGEINGELRIWHKVTLGFEGPEASETDDMNPFTFYRLDVTFEHTESDRTLVVPGYFAADGNAANSGASSGNVWLAHLTPDSIGEWTWSARFIIGESVYESNFGTSAGYMDGLSGSFFVDDTDKTGRDLRGKGLLRYVEEHHLQFAGTGEWFLKAGADSPENFLAYRDFDNTPDKGNRSRRKSWEPHVIDYKDGIDPTWGGGKGRGIIGAVNYLSEKGMNAFSFLSMNIDGDDKNVFPYISDSEDDRRRIDVSKTAQWEVVFEHADHMGMFMHFKTQETENDQLLDGGTLGPERTLYYRELIARFGHHLALNWNLGEENSNTEDEREKFSDFFTTHDPYQHPVVVHTFTGAKEVVYEPLLGFENIHGASLQSPPENVYADTVEWVSRSTEEGRKWIVSNDEQGDAQTGVVPDDEDPEHELIRREVLWGNIMGGGAGVEYYFGLGHPNSDLTCEDFRSRDRMWDISRYALEFFTQNELPFWDMISDNSTVAREDARCLSQTNGDVFVVYLPNGGSAELVLIDQTGFYDVHWYDPRNGGPLYEGTTGALVGGGSRSIGTAPAEEDQDWVALIRRTGSIDLPEDTFFPPTTFPSTQPSILGSEHPSETPSSLPTFQDSSTLSETPSAPPSMQPSELPSSLPSMTPSLNPTPVPSTESSNVPSSAPTDIPSRLPSNSPTITPSAVDSLVPTNEVSASPSVQISNEPSFVASEQPSVQSVSPTAFPTDHPTGLPTSAPTTNASEEPSHAESELPSLQPTEAPSDEPTGLPTAGPTKSASEEPSYADTELPSLDPTEAPSDNPTGLPTAGPSKSASEEPSYAESELPSLDPTEAPSDTPTALPTPGPTKGASGEPPNAESELPSLGPTEAPFDTPTVLPTPGPTKGASEEPSYAESEFPSLDPTEVPSDMPTLAPSDLSSSAPSRAGSDDPSASPSPSPSTSPSDPPSDPTSVPSDSSLMPSSALSAAPSTTSQPPSVVPPTSTVAPSIVPSVSPSMPPTSDQNGTPSGPPTGLPSAGPSLSPTLPPTNLRSSSPVMKPTVRPTAISMPPTSDQSGIPSGPPTGFPTAGLSASPTVAPTDLPSSSSAIRPSATPAPSMPPTNDESRFPSAPPTGLPSGRPSLSPTLFPPNLPTSSLLQASATPTSTSSPPTTERSFNPSGPPTGFPSAFPSGSPTLLPTDLPSSSAAMQPTAPPTTTSTPPTSNESGIASPSPSGSPSASPSLSPTLSPTALPSSSPAAQPSASPTTTSAPPTNDVGEIQSAPPTGFPSASPSISPTVSPTRPSSSPTMQPSPSPSLSPSDLTMIPSASPSVVPSNGPSLIPTGPTTNPPSAEAEVADFAVTPDGYNCEPLHDDLQIRWAVNEDEIAIELVGRIGETDYMAFGRSGRNDMSSMLGSDVVIVDLFDGEARAKDFYMNARSVCTDGNGVCADAESNEFNNDISNVSGERSHGLSIVRYTRPLVPHDINDDVEGAAVDLPLSVEPDQSTYIVWAIGPINEGTGMPSFHSKFAIEDASLELGRETRDSCQLLKIPDPVSSAPSSSPSTNPLIAPSFEPSNQLSLSPSSLPSPGPSVRATFFTASYPSLAPSTGSPSSSSSLIPTAVSTAQPSLTSSDTPSAELSAMPSPLPTGSPTLYPTKSGVPSSAPTKSMASLTPSVTVSTGFHPTDSHGPTTALQSESPSTIPSLSGSTIPSELPSLQPSESEEPSTLWTSAPTPGPSSLSMTPSIVLLAEADDHNTAKVCDDDMETTFIIEEERAPRDCLWLRSTTAYIRDGLCLPGGPARDICEETCQKCTDECYDEESFLFSVLDQVEGITTCSWLRSRPNLLETHCQPDKPAYQICKDTCNACGVERSISVDQISPRIESDGIRMYRISRPEGKCRDEETQLFSSDPNQPDGITACTWLKSQPSLLEANCVPGREAYTTCPKTCGACFDNIFLH